MNAFAFLFRPEPLRQTHSVNNTPSDKSIHVTLKPLCLLDIKNVAQLKRKEDQRACTLCLFDDEYFHFFDVLACKLTDLRRGSPQMWVFAPLPNRHAHTSDVRVC